MRTTNFQGKMETHMVSPLSSGPPCFKAFSSQWDLRFPISVIRVNEW